MTNDATHLLHTLLAALPHAEPTRPLPETPVSRITADSRAVVPGAIFVREALAWLAAAWHGHPSHAMRVVGITGTDGKTTTTTLVSSVLSAAGEHVGLLTTIGATIGEQHFETAPHTTTPDALELQHYLRHMVEAGVTTAVLEVTNTWTSTARSKTTAAPKRCSSST